MHFQLLLMIKIQFLETFIPLAILPQKAVLAEHFQGSSNMPELQCICTNLSQLHITVLGAEIEKLRPKKIANVSSEEKRRAKSSPRHLCQSST